MDASSAQFPQTISLDAASLLSENFLHRLGSLSESCFQIYEASKDVFARSRANHFPTSPTEMSRYTSFVEAAQPTLSHYDKIIADIDQLSTYLKVQRDGVDRAMRAAQSILSPSPVRRIPPEILSEIFDIHCSSEPSIRTVTSEAVTSSTLALAHTCSFWRQASMFTPKYWRFLRINLLHVTENTPFTDHIIDVITRSGDSGLVLNIEGVYDSLNGSWDGQPTLEVTGQRARVLDVLVQNASRWQTAVIALSDNLLRYLQESQSAVGHLAQFSMLQTLDCSRCPDTIVMNEHHPLKLFHHCPSLEQLSAKALWLYHPVDGSNITHLKLEVYHGCSLAELLVAFPMLQSCDFDFQGWRGDDDELDMPISNDALIRHDLLELCVRSAKYGEFMQTQMGPFARSLCLPRLTSLNLPQDLLIEDQFTSIQRLITQSNCPVTSLTLPGPIDQNAIQLLSSLPSLDNLSLSFEDVSIFRDLMTALTITEASCVAPKLAALGVGTDSWDEPADAPLELCAMVASRCSRVDGSEAVVSGLKFLRLINVTISSEVEASLDYHERAGLVIERFVD